jgi:ethanolamine utilization cobalamin adenosyltransferase
MEENKSENKSEKKSESMTSLSGNRMVSKTHGRIAFRGKIDTLEAEVVEAQVLADSLGEKGLCANLGEILDCLRAIVSSEVKETPLPPPFLFGMNEEEIHRKSHETFVGVTDFKAMLPAYTHGPMAARLNVLRTKIREAELLAVKVFGTGTSPGDEGQGRDDIVLALNRLSSALWWLFCERIR